jgi:tRNA modification GTPase
MEGIPVELIDTAGLRHSTDEAESIGIAKSRQTIADADIVILVLDATATLHAEDSATMEALSYRPHLIAVNKSDLSPSSPLVSQRADAIPTSALTGSGVSELREAIVRLITVKAPATETGLLTNLRQQQAVLNTLGALGRAHQAVASAIPHEIVLLDLYEALQSLDSLTGSTTSDDILRLIFSKFCIGK